MVTTFELPGCVDMWTVKSDENEEEENKEEQTERHKEEKMDIKPDGEKEGQKTGQHDYLILSRSDSTMVSITAYTWDGLHGKYKYCKTIQLGMTYL